MAELRSGQVYFKEAPAGVLRELIAGGSQFQYDSSYLETNASQIAACFPQRAEPYNWTNGLHPFFQHLTAEGWLRDIQSRASGIANEDDLGLLLRFGRDCIGAVSVVGPAPPDGQSQISAPGAAAVLDGARTISGVQRKVLAVLNGRKFIQVPATGPAPYIVKLPSDNLPHLVANEDLSLSVCRLLLGAKEVTLAHRGFVEGWPEQSLIVTRFDRTESGERLRMEDFAQILVQPKGRDFQGKYESSYNACAAIIQRHSSLPVVDASRLFQRLLVFALIGNTDAHLKNFSLLETANGLRLSPCYDVVNSVLYANLGVTTRFGLAILDHYVNHEDVDRQMLINLGRSFNLTEKAIMLCFQQVEEKKERLFRLLRDNSPLPGPHKELYEDIVRSAWLRIISH